MLKTFLNVSSMLSLTHETTEAVKRTRNSGAGVDLDKNVLLGVNVNLQQSSSVQWTVH